MSHGQNASVRTFESGATRDGNPGKHEVARFLSPLVLAEYCAYMHRNRIQVDGTVREPDNWKKGFELSSYKDSLVRHTMDAWLIHDHGVAVRPETGEEVDLVEALCGVMFNCQGWLYEILMKRLGNGAARPNGAGATGGP